MRTIEIPVARRFLIFTLSLGLGLAANAQTQSWRWAENKDKQISILLFGDTNIQDREDPSDAFVNVLPTLRKADLRFCNLEGAFAGTSTDPRVPDIPHKSRWKHSDPRMVKGIVHAGIDAVGVANNVTYPWMALVKSLSVLKENGIAFAGGGNNLEEAHRPVVIEKNGVRTGFLSYACTVFPFQHAATPEVPGIASLRVETYFKPAPNLDKPGMNMQTHTVPVREEIERMRRDIRTLKERADIVIVSIHWGISDHTELIEYQVEIAHQAIESGADVIMGHGNHLLGAVEVWNNKPIFYGMGNFAFDWQKMRGKKDGVMVKLDVANKSLSRVSLVPLTRDEKNNVTILSPVSAGGKELLSKIRQLSEGLASMTVSESEVLVNLNAGRPSP